MVVWLGIALSQASKYHATLWPRSDRLKCGFPQTAPIDDAEKSTVSYTVHTCLKQHLHNTKREDLAESTGVVPAKYLPKVKLEFLTTLESARVGKLCILWLVRVMMLHLSVGWTVFDVINQRVTSESWKMNSKVKGDRWRPAKNPPMAKLVSCGFNVKEVSEWIPFS